MCTKNEVSRSKNEEVSLCGYTLPLKEILIRGMFMNNSCIRFVDSAKNLGVILDRELPFE